MSSGNTASHFTAGAVGEPGRRIFYLYVVVDGAPYWFVAEKQQVAALGAQSIESIPRTGLAVDDTVVETILSQNMEVPSPDDPDQILFRIDSMALRVNPDVETVTVMLTGTEDDQDFEFDITVHYLRAMALAALASVESGRPTCPKCQLPEDPEGHDCPSSNGHRPLSS
ncbi:MAG: DUF3090 family protein [Acidimicrobiia bacterium]|nr:DUF3090 family protein [Acidimicrobiia bacterium]